MVKTLVILRGKREAIFPVAALVLARTSMVIARCWCLRGGGMKEVKCNQHEKQTFFCTYLMTLEMCRQVQ